MQTFARNDHHVRGAIWQIVVICLGCVVIAAVLYPVFAQSKISRRTPYCLSYVKQLALAHLMYADDYDNRLPRRKWVDAIFPYTKSEHLYTCPVIEEQHKTGGYAFNSKLSGSLLPSKQPEQTPLIYDSTELYRNAEDPFTSLPNPGRHGGHNNIGFADAHTRAYTFDQSQQFKAAPH